MGGGPVRLILQGGIGPSIAIHGAAHPAGVAESGSIINTIIEAIYANIVSVQPGYSHIYSHMRNWNLSDCLGLFQTSG